mgnify:FL=1
MISIQHLKRLVIIAMMSVWTNFAFPNELSYTIADVPLNAVWNQDRTAAVATLKQLKGTQLFCISKAR